MSIWIASGLVVDEQTDLCRGANEDAIATDARRRGEMTMRIIDAYNQRNMQLEARSAQKLNRWRGIRQGGTVVAGDFNADGM